MATLTFTNTADFVALNNCSINDAVLPGLFNFSADDSGTGIDEATLQNAANATTLDVSTNAGSLTVTPNTNASQIGPDTTYSAPLARFPSAFGATDFDVRAPITWTGETSVHTNAKPHKQQYYENAVDNGDITGWTTDTSLPAVRYYSQAIVTKNRVYLLGGSSAGSITSAVYTAPINSDGTLGAWSTGTSLPNVLADSQAIVTKDRVYLLGGNLSGSSVVNVYTAPLNSDGTLGAWTTGPSLPGVLRLSSAVVTKNRVYLLGGFTSTTVSTVYTAPINSDGTLGTWSTGTSLPGAFLNSQAVVTKDRIYLLGGNHGSGQVSTVYYAPVNSDGTLGTWATGTSLPGALADSQAFVTGGKSTG